MGTKFQYAMNPLATTQSNDSFSVNMIDNWDFFRNKEIKEDLESSVVKFKDSMDRRMIEQQRAESIKKTMLMHEDIFKHQVRELHRVYSVQKQLMDEMRNDHLTTTKHQQDRYWVAPSTPRSSDHTCKFPNFFDRHQPTTTSGSNNKIHVQSVLMREENKHERSGSCSGKMGFDLERQPAAADSVEEDGFEEDQTGPSSYGGMKTSSNQIGSEGFFEESDVELTLSIGRGSYSGTKKSTIKSEMKRDALCGGSSGGGGGGIGSNTTAAVGNSSAASATLDHHQQPKNKWLFQGLSFLQ